MGNLIYGRLFRVATSYGGIWERERAEPHLYERKINSLEKKRPEKKEEERQNVVYTVVGSHEDRARPTVGNFLSVCRAVGIDPYAVGRHEIGI